MPKQNKHTPYDIDAERGALAAMIISDEARETALVQLTSQSFYEPAHIKIFEQIQALASENLPIDVLTVSSAMEKNKTLKEVGGRVYLMDLRYQVASPYHIDYYISLLRDAEIRRRLLSSISEIQELINTPMSSAEILDQAEQKIFAIAEHQIKRDFNPITETTKQVFDYIVETRENKRPSGLSTGYPNLDNKLLGLQPSNLIIVAARPSMGKTALALNIARYCAIQMDIPVGIFSLEMSEKELVMRILSGESKVDSYRMRSGHLRGEDYAKILLHLNPVSKAPIYIDDSPTLSILELATKARRLKRKCNVGVLLVDYIQLMSDNKRHKDRLEELTSISRALKAIARELDIPVIALSQLSRNVEYREKNAHRPQLSDLRECGAIEQDADIVMFVYRPEVYKILTDEKGNPTNNLAEIIIGKQRNGPIGTVKLAFIKDYTSFENLETNEGYENETAEEGVL